MEKKKEKKQNKKDSGRFTYESDLGLKVIKEEPDKNKEKKDGKQTV